MDAFPRVVAVGLASVVLRRLEAADWRIELELARVPDVPVWTMYAADMTEEQARERATRNVARA